MVGAVGAVAARDLARDPCGQVGHVEAVDAAHAALSIEQALPRGLDPARERRHHAKARDNHTSHQRLLRPPRRRSYVSTPRGQSLATGQTNVYECGGNQLFAFFSRNLTASPTVRMVSAASSGISQPNSSSKAITSSTVSRLSAPRSSIKLAFSVTLSASTPRCSTTIFFTRSAMLSLIAAPSCPCIGLDWSAHPSEWDRLVVATGAESLAVASGPERALACCPSQAEVRLSYFKCLDQHA